MNDLLIVVCVLMFGIFCAGIGSLYTQIVLLNKMEDFKRMVVLRVNGAYGHNSGPALLVQDLLGE